MSDKLNAWGVPPEYHAHAKHFEKVFRDLGYTPAQIEATIKWGAAFDGNPEDRIPQFDRLCKQHNIDLVNSDLAISLHQQVEEKGIEAMPQPPAQASSPQADAARLHEIREEMRRPRADSQYWKDPSMRDELRELLERAGPDAGEYVPGPTGNDRARLRR